jgi:NDP-sugar pyrophosphorylase family protein
MDAAILVGGQGTRLKGVVSDRPKPMAMVAGRPFLEWVTLYLRSVGVGRVVLCTGHMAEVIEDYFSALEAPGMSISYSREEVPLGTGGALRTSLPVIPAERFLVLNGDSLCPFSPAEMIDKHAKAGAHVTMWLVEVENSSRYGTVHLDDEGQVIAFEEKNPARASGLINAGIYLVEKALIESLPEGRFLSLESDVFPNLPPGSIAGVIGEGPFLDIGTPESYSAATEFITDHFDRIGEMHRKEIR